MMDPFLTGYFLVKGIAIGLVATAPVGPVNVLVIQRTLRYGRLNGFMTGIGSMLGDTLFATIAAFGLSTISTFVLDQVVVIQIIGGLLLIAMGIHTFRTKPQFAAIDDGQGTDLIRSLASTFALTITNPLTMLAFATLIAGVGGVGDGDMAAAATLVAGVLAGAASWWLIVVLGIGLLRRRIDDDVLALINRVSGTLIVIFGIAMLVRLLAAPA